MTGAPSGAAEAARYFELLYGASAVGYLPLLTFDGPVTWVPGHVLDWAAVRATQLASTKNVYHGIGLQPEDLGPTKRGGADTVIALPGMWADIDVLHPVHRKPDLPPTIDDALALVDEFPLPPTLIVSTGHGLQPWWLFRELWTFDEDAERLGAQDLARRFQATLRAKAHAHGWTIDTTSDLARVFRVPGTVNRKDRPVPVTIMSCDDTRRYDPSDFEPYLLDDTAGSYAPPVNHGVQPSVGPLFIREDAEPPFDKMTALLAADRRFKATWERTRTDLHDKSPSGWDMALADAAVEAGWSNQEAANLLIAHRRKHGDDPKLREDYLAGTIQKARLLHGTLDDLLSTAQSPEDQRAVRLAYISQHLGVSVLGMVRHPGPPSTYRLKTSLGDLPLAGITDITIQARFRNHLADGTGHLVRSVKPDLWHPVAQALIDICVDDVIPDQTEEGRVRDWVDSYLSKREICATPEEGEVLRCPFRDDARGGTVCWFGDDMHGWLVTERLEPVKKQEMGALLRAHGYEQVQVKIEVAGKRTTRLVWCQSLDRELEVDSQNDV